MIIDSIVMCKKEGGQSVLHCFDSRKRKVGIISLAISVLMASGWVRSLAVGDIVVVVGDHEYDPVLFSVNGTIGIGQADNFITRGVFYQTGWRAEPALKVANRISAWLGLHDKKSNRYGFGGACYTVRRQSSAIVVSYALLTVPLVVCSAVCLLAERCSVKITGITTRIQDEV